MYVLRVYSVHCESRAYLSFQSLANTCSFILVQQGSLKSFLQWIELFWCAVKVCILKLYVSLWSTLESVFYPNLNKHTPNSGRTFHLRVQYS